MIHSKQIIPILVLGVLASCSQQSDIPKADKFPGFVQIGRDQGTSRLFIDLESVKRSNDGTVSFKLLRVIDSGYAIQDAMTNCRDNFKGLTGTKFTNEGVSDSEYPGDTDLLSYKDNPSLMTMIGKVCDKADESRIITGAFDDIKALEVVYGPYHPEVKAAYWTGMNPPTTLSQSASDFTGKDGLVKIVFSQEYREGNDTKRILFTQTNLTEGGNDCHACGVLLGAIIFVHVGDKWRIESENRYLDVMGVNGEPPELSWVNIGKDIHVITVKMTDIHQGVVDDFIGIYKLGISGWRSLLELNEEGETLSDVRLAFSDVNPKLTYAEVLITVENEIEGSKTVKEKKFIFNGSQYQLQSLDESMVKATQNIPAQSLTQIEKVADSKQITSSESTAHSMVMSMLEYAMNDGGLSRESQIQETKLQIEGLTKPTKGNKKIARSINDEALMLFNNNDFESAVKKLTEASRMDPSDVEIVNNLGYSYLKQGNLDLAQQSLITALTMSPGRSPAWSNLGDVFAIKGDISHAIACFSNVYRFSKNRVRTHQFMKGLNEKEDVATLKQARSIVIDWAEKSYPEVN